MQSRLVYLSPLNQLDLLEKEVTNLDKRIFAVNIGEIIAKYNEKVADYDVQLVNGLKNKIIFEEANSFIGEIYYKILEKIL